jgi:hypothetical protein
LHRAGAASAVSFSVRDNAAQPTGTESGQTERGQFFSRSQFVLQIFPAANFVKIQTHLDPS